jgi:hypothetical protein
MSVKAKTLQLRLVAGSAFESTQGRHCRETARALRELADEAEQGNCIGVVLAYLDNNNAPRYFTTGHTESKPREAAWLASKLASVLVDAKS